MSVQEDNTGQSSGQPAAGASESPAMAEMEERNRSLQESLSQKSAQLDCVNEIAKRLAGSLNADEVLRIAQEQLRKIIRPDLIVFYQIEGDKLINKEVGEFRPSLDHHGPDSKNIGECLCGLTALDGVPVFSENIETDPRCTLSECKDAGIKSFAALPIIFDGSVKGVLGLASLTPRDFEQEGPFLQTIAQHITWALHRSSLVEQERRNSEKLRSSLVNLERARNEIRRDHEALSSIIETSPCGIVTLDKDGRIVLANRVAENILGLTREEISSRMYNDRQFKITGVNGEPFPSERLPFSIVKSTGASVHGLVHAIETKGGQRSIIRINATPLKDDSDELTAVVATLEDITDELGRRKELDEQYSLMKGILHRAADGICICHNVEQYPFVRFTHWNPKMIQITGYTMDEINESGWYQTLYPEPETRRKAIERMTRMRRGDDISAEEWTIKTKSGSNRTLSISTSLLKQEDDSVHVLAIIQDVTDRKLAEDALQDHNLKLSQLNERLRNIVGATRKLAVCSTVKDMGRMVLEEFAHNMSAQGGSLYLIENDELVLSHTLDSDHVPHSIALPPKEGSAFRRVMDERRPILVEDFGSEPDLAGSGWDGYSDSSALIMPLSREDGEILGIISLHNRTLPPFTQQDKEIALILVSYTCEALRATHALEELKLSETRLRDFYDNAPVMMHSIDKKGIIRKVNNTWLSEMGYELEEVLGRPVLEFMAPESHGLLQSSLKEFWIDGRAKDIPYKYLKKNGQVFDVILSSVVMDDLFWGEISLTVAKDVTEQKLIEAALTEREEMFRTLFERAGDGIIVVDAQGPGLGKIVSANRAAAEMHGYDLEDFLKLTMEDLDTPEEADRMKGVLERVLDDEIVTVEHFHRKSDGTVFQMELSTGLIEIGDHKHLLSINRDITERKAAERKLVESEEFNRRLVHHAPVGILYLDIDGTLSFTNPACNRIFGVPEDKPSPILGVNMLDLPLVAQQPHIAKCFSELINEGKAQNDVEINYRSPLTNKDYVLLSSATPRLAADGSIAGSVVMLSDVTDRKRSEQAMRKIVEGVSGEVGEMFFQSSVRRLAEILEADYTHIGKIIKRDDKTIIRTLAYCEQGQLLDDFEYDLAGAPCEIAFQLGLCSYTEKVAEKFPNHKALQMKGIEAYVGICLYDSHGVPAGILASSYKRPLEKVEFFQAVLRIFASRAAAEIERMENEKALMEREATLNTLLQAAPIGIGQVTSGRRLGWTNQLLCDMLGYTGEELKGQSARILYETEEEFIRVGQVKHPEVLRRGRGTVETRMRRKDGDCFDAILSSSAIEAGDLSAGLVFTVMDVTERKQLEEQLMRSQKMEAVGTLAGGIAHDFNNLLQVIHGYADFALYELQPGQTGFSEITKIKNAARSAGELTKSLLTFSRRVESRLRVVDLSHEVEQATRILKRTIPKMINLELRLSKELKTIMADPAQLQQIVMNLAVNARDAMDQAGHLVIETYNAGLDEDYCRTHLGTKPGEYAVLSVSDTGCGISKDVMARIFEPFYTTKEVGKGTGLGLAIVYGIVQNHGGSVTCYSESGHGTTFKIYLPVFRGANEEVGGPAGRRAMVGGSETILIIDDEPRVRELGEMILKRFGYTVFGASNGKEGLEIFMREKDRIDVVILDLIMPEMSGRECLRAIMQAAPSTNVLIASGYDANGHLDAALDEGAKLYIKKPYDTRELLDAIRKTLDE